ncbi:MAG: hypothetical protein ACI8S6_000713 [Myxococcota bacterium]|jgi:hypothetical protein
MRPEDLQARLRLRTAWEATDLGVLMLRRWAAPIAAAWGRCVAPVFIVLVAVSWWVPLLSAVLLWWLKPLWGRVVLYVLSRALFGAPPAPRDVAAAKLWRSGLAEALVWRRLSPARSFLAPVRGLEKLSGPAARRRRTDLSMDRALLPAASLGLACLLLELVVVTGVLGALSLTLPDSPRYDPQNLLYAAMRDGLPRLLGPLLVTSYAVAISVVEPLYVAAGFGLYLNRRTWLEGWDIELTFRQLSARLKAAGLTLLALIALSPPAHAEPADPQQAIAAVLEAPEFGHAEVQTSLQLRFDPRDWLPEGGEQAPVVIPGLAEALRAILLGILGILTVALGVGLVRSRDLLRIPRRPAAKHTPEPIATGAQMAAPTGLPGDITAAARAADSPLSGLSLLYRGALRQLIAVRQVEIEAGATESECLACARSALPEPAARYFSALTAAWSAAAYDRQEPDDLAALINGWAAHFGETR